MELIKRVKIDGFECHRCNFQWAPRFKGKLPKQCPACKSIYWNRPRLTILQKRQRRKLLADKIMRASLR